jgi:hypothetical protein
VCANSQARRKPALIVRQPDRRPTIEKEIHTMRFNTTTAAVALAFSFAAAAPALAADPAFVGTWGADKDQCKLKQDNEGAPMVFTTDGYDQHETHCKFKSVDGKDNTWKISSECTVEGSAEKFDFTLMVDGDKMFMGDDTDGDEYMRCK